MQEMINNSKLVVSAWDGDKLVDIARSLSDFHYACYLSDLAVDTEYQLSGIGKKLLSLTREQLGKQCNLILVAAPDADSYYRHPGITSNPRCRIRGPGQDISTE